jgi:hypothetical protein
MSVGLKALTLIAILAYLSAFLIRSRTATDQVAEVPIRGGLEPLLVPEVS